MIPNLFFSFQVYSNLPVTAAKPNFLVTPKQLHEFYEIFQINFGTQYESVKHLTFFISIETVFE